MAQEPQSNPGIWDRLYVNGDPLPGIIQDITIGGSLRMDTQGIAGMDGVVIGKTVKKTYVVKQVHPGRHTVLSKTEGDPTINVVAVAGQNYFVWQEVKMGVFMARTKLHSIGETEGKAKVLKCERVGIQQ